MSGRAMSLPVWFPAISRSWMHMRSPVEVEMDATVAEGLVQDMPGVSDAQRQRSAGIVGLGTALPAEAIASDAIAERIGLASGWIERRTGIASRRRASADMRVADLAADAGRDALADAGVDAAAVDTVLVATLSP